MNIKLYRSKMCLSQKELADLLGVTRTSIVNYENGKMPTRKMIDKMCELFQCSIVELYGSDILRCKLNDGEKTSLIIKLFYSLDEQYKQYLLKEINYEKKD